MLYNTLVQNISPVHWPINILIKFCLRFQVCSLMKKRKEGIFFLICLNISQTSDKTAESLSSNKFWVCADLIFLMSTSLLSHTHTPVLLFLCPSGHIPKECPIRLDDYHSTPNWEETKVSFILVILSGPPFTALVVGWEHCHFLPSREAVKRRQTWWSCQSSSLRAPGEQFSTPLMPDKAKDFLTNCTKTERKRERCRYMEPVKPCVSRVHHGKLAACSNVFSINILWLNNNK